MDEARLVDLETKLAYQEETVRVLNEVVARQQKQIDQLEAACRQMLERLAATTEGTTASTPDDLVG